MIQTKACCGICDQEKEAGFYLYQLYICLECEQQIVQAEPEQEIYHQFVKKLKGMTKETLYS